MPTGVYVRTKYHLDILKKRKKKEKKGVYLECKRCGNTYYVSRYREKSSIFCSRSCLAKSKVVTQETKEKLKKSLLGVNTWTKTRFGNKSSAWKGDSACLMAKHSFISRTKGTPSKCEHCGTENEKWYDWANIDHKYSRNLEDYIRLCRKCHRKYDYDNHLSNIGSRGGSIPNKI